MWERIKAFHQRSLTIGLAHLLVWVGIVEAGLFMFPDVAKDVGLATFVPTSYLGPYTLGIALLTIAARLRGLVTVTVKPVAPPQVEAPTHDAG